MALDRRVFGREFRDALGVGGTWFRTLQQRGVIPRGRTDPGGRRQWWTESEVNAALTALKDQTERGRNERGGRVAT